MPTVIDHCRVQEHYSHGGLTKRTIAENERMPSECPDHKRKANETRQEPICQGRQRTPQRQVRSIVNIESCEQQNVRDRHAADVHSQPAAP